MSKSIIRRFINFNVALSHRFDNLIPEHARLDGNREFQSRVLPVIVGQGGVLYELGGGSQPYTTEIEKRRLNLTVFGLDISEEELLNAPHGIYDKYFVHDLCTFVGDGDGDVAICQATLEHVPNTAGAIRAIASCLKDGGRAAVFVPCRNAIFARINLAIPEKMKRIILFSIFPQADDGHNGFPAYYNRCVPLDMEKLAEENGLTVETKRLFWSSSYFRFLFPLYVMWRASQFMLWIFLRDNAAETFYYVFRKGHPSSAGDFRQRVATI